MKEEIVINTDNPASPESQPRVRKSSDRLSDPLPVRVPEDGGELPNPLPVLPAVVPEELLMALAAAPPGVVEWIDRIATARLERLLRRAPQLATVLDDLLPRTWSGPLPPPVLRRPGQGGSDASQGSGGP